MLVAKKKYSYDDNRYSTENKENNRKSINNRRKKKNKNLFIKVSILFWVVIISSTFIFVLLRYTEITEARYDVLRLKKEIKELETHLQDVNAKYDSLTRSDIIEKAALEKVGMQYPKYEQMVFLDTEETEGVDFTVSDDSELTNEQVKEDKQDKKLFGFIKSSIRKLYYLLD